MIWYYNQQSFTALKRSNVNNSHMDQEIFYKGWTEYPLRSLRPLLSSDNSIELR